MVSKARNACTDRKAVSGDRWSRSFDEHLAWCLDVPEESLVNESSAREGTYQKCLGPPPQFDTSTTYEDSELYALDHAGRLLRFHHVIAKKDQLAGGARPEKGCFDPATGNPIKCKVMEVTPKVDCSKPEGQFSLECQGGGLAKPDLSTIEIGQTDLSLARYKFTHTLSAPIQIPNDWASFSAVIPSQLSYYNLIVYGAQPDGALLTRSIKRDREANAFTVQQAPIPAGSGWSTMTNVFSTGQGVIYAVDPAGDLIWYQHKNNFDLTAAPQWQQRAVGRGWNGLKTIFSPGRGVIYVVHHDGRLMWYRHVAYKEGYGLERADSWEGPKEVGSGWNSFLHLAAGPNGSIYAVNAAGELLFYRHLGWQTGEAGVAAWELPVVIAQNWSNYRQIFTAVTQPEDVVIPVR
jgi:hypothetical protein